MTDFGTPGSFPSAPMPPSSGDRTGPPWEQPGAFFSRWIDTAKMILMDPMGGFKNVRRTGGLGAPLTYYLLGGSVFLAVFLLLNLVGFGLPGLGGRGGALMAGGMVMMLVFVICAVVVGFFIGTGIVHLALSLLGGAKHGYEATARAFAYASGSTLPLQWIPICGPFVGLYGLFCAVMGLAEMQETSPVKAAIAVFAPAVLCCVIGFILTVLLGVGAGLMGGASQMQ
jgi:hypothetical protein